MRNFFHWSTLIGTLVLSAHQPAALSQATPNNSFTIDYQGTTYKVDTYGAGKTYQDTKNLISPLNFKSSIIWNGAILASNIAQSIADKGRFTTSTNPYATINLPYEEYQGLVFVQRTLFGGNITTQSWSQTFGSPRNGWVLVNPQSQQDLIIPAGNVSGGSSNNITSNLGTSLLPQFEGGVLTVDQANKNIADNFTLDGSTTNAIDIQGNNPLFSGIFSDASTGTPGNISFTNTSSPTSSRAVVLTGKNTFTGKTTFGQRVFLELRKGGSIENSQTIEIQRGGRLNIDTPNQTTIVRNITGQGHLQPNSTTNVVIDQPGIVFDGRVQTSRGSLIKSGVEAWTLTSTYNHVDGGITVKDGSFIMKGGSFDDTHTGVATPITVNPGARFGIQSNTTTNTGSVSVGGVGSRSHLDINGSLIIKGDLNLKTRSRTLFNSGDIGDPNLNTGARSLVVTGTLSHNGENIDSRGGNYTIDVGELRGNSNILIDAETLTLATRNDSLFDGRFGDFNTGQQGGTLIKEGAGNLTLSKNGGITNLGNLTVNKGVLQLRSGGNQVNTLAKSMATES